jgi:hypothetical protein
MEDYPKGFTGTLANCPLLRKGGNIHIANDTLDDRGKIFIHTNQEATMVNLKDDLLTPEESIRICEGCEFKALHNPVLATKYIYLNKAGHLLRTKGVLLDGPQMLGV